MSCDIGEVTERAHSPTFPPLHLRHNSFSNPSVALPTSQLILPSVASPRSQFILQPFFRFSYVRSSSLNSPGEPPMQRMLILRPERIAIREKFCHGSVGLLVVDSSVVRAPARKPRNPGSRPDQEWNFPLAVLKPANRWPLSENSIFNVIQGTSIKSVTH